MFLIQTVSLGMAPDAIPFVDVIELAASGTEAGMWRDWKGRSFWMEDNGSSSAGSPQAGRCTTVGLQKRDIETAHTAKSGSKGDLGEWQVGLIDQALGGLDAAGRGDSARAGADVTDEQPAKMAGPDAQPIGQPRYRTAVEESFLDEPHPANHCRLAAEPGRAAGCGLRPTAQAGPKSSLLGFRCGTKEPDVLGQRWAHRTDRPAIDLCGADAGEENAVIAAIARNARSLTDLPIEDGSFAVLRRHDESYRPNAGARLAGFGLGRGTESDGGQTTAEEII
jgi:hypothetical protein